MDENAVWNGRSLVAYFRSSASWLAEAQMKGNFSWIVNRQERCVGWRRQQEVKSKMWMIDRRWKWRWNSHLFLIVPVATMCLIPSAGWYKGRCGSGKCRSPVQVFASTRTPLLDQWYKRHVAISRLLAWTGARQLFLILLFDLLWPVFIIILSWSHNTHSSKA